MERGCAACGSFQYRFAKAMSAASERPTKPFVQIDPRWWSLGVVDGFKARPPQGGVSDQFSYFSGRVEGEAAREQGRSVDEVLAK